MVKDVTNDIILDYCCSDLCDVTILCEKKGIIIEDVNFDGYMYTLACEDRIIEFQPTENKS